MPQCPSPQGRQIPEPRATQRQRQRRRGLLLALADAHGAFLEALLDLRRGHGALWLCDTAGAQRHAESDLVRLVSSARAGVRLPQAAVPVAPASERGIALPVVADHGLPLHLQGAADRARLWQEPLAQTRLAPLQQRDFCPSSYEVVVHGQAQFHDQGDVHNIAIECSGGVRT